MSSSSRIPGLFQSSTYRPVDPSSAPLGTQHDGLDFSQENDPSSSSVLEDDAKRRNQTTTSNSGPGLRWKGWALEYWALLGSVLAFAGMIALLAVFDGRPIFDSNGVSLNTLVSTLSLTMKALAAYVVAECMAQWKWILFPPQLEASSPGELFRSDSEPRPLMDFDRIDAATRGPLGSLRVLLRTRRSMPLRFASVLTILLLALDPFAQQVVQIREQVEFQKDIRAEITDTARISRAQSYNNGSAMVTHRMIQDEGTLDEDDDDSTTASTVHDYSIKTDVTMSMQSAILAGLSRSATELRQETLVTCPNGNCTWDPFHTLGVCQRCNDITADLKHVDGFEEVFGALENVTKPASVFDSVSGYVLPNGHYITNIDGCPFMSGSGSQKCCDRPPDGVYDIAWGAAGYITTTFGTGNPNKTNSMKDVDTLIWSTSLIYPDTSTFDTSEVGEGSKCGTAPKWPKVPMQAMECAIYYCVQNIEASVTGNTLHERQVENKTFVRNRDSWERYQEPEHGGERFTPPADERDSLEFHPQYSVADYTDLELERADGMGGVYWIHEDSVKSLSAYMQNAFRSDDYSGSRVSKRLQETIGWSAGDTRYEPAGFNGVSREFPTSDGFKSLVDVSPSALWGLLSWDHGTGYHMERGFEALAVAMSNEMRRSFDPELRKADEMYQGYVANASVVYEIRWPWMVLHGVVLLSAVLFLATTLVKASSDRSLALGSAGVGAGAVPLWKSSSLATIRKGHQMGGILDQADTVKEMEDVARKAHLPLSKV